jgi:hypothetical protein
MNARVSFEMSVTFYKTTLNHIPEDSSTKNNCFERGKQALSLIKEDQFVI